MKIFIVMPAYNAEQTLEKTCLGLPKIYSEIVVCDDGSSDGTYECSKKLKLTSLQHSKNKGYGANQKTLYDYALGKGAEIIVMVHPDNQYTTSNLPKMIEKIERGAAMVMGTRMDTALKNKMPYWKYVCNRFLSSVQNFVFGTNLSEFHSGLRAYDANELRDIPYQAFSDDFVFDSEMIADILRRGKKIDEVPVECFYNNEVSSINFRRSFKYGLETLRTLLSYKLGRYGKQKREKAISPISPIA